MMKWYILVKDESNSRQNKTNGFHLNININQYDLFMFIISKFCQKPISNIVLVNQVYYGHSLDALNIVVG